MAKSKIDFERVAMLLDVVQKVASVAPQYMAISSAAMNEVKEMQDVAAEEAAELGRQRLKAEQEEAARITEHNQKAADEQVDAEAKQKAIVDAKNRNPAKPINVKPGEPDELEAIKQQGEPAYDQGVLEPNRRI